MPYKDIEKRREYALAHYYKHRDKRLKKSKEYRGRPEVKEQRAEWNKRWYESNKEEILVKRRIRELASPRRLIAYGLTVETYKDLLDQQNGKCAICQTEKTYLIKNFL